MVAVAAYGWRIGWEKQGREVEERRKRKEDERNWTVTLRSNGGEG